MNTRDGLILKEKLSADIHDLAKKISKIKNNIIRVELPCPDIDPLTWLNNQKSSKKFYWSNRKGNFEMAGNDSTDYKSVFTLLQQNLTCNIKNLRYYGGVSFFNKKQTGIWKLFGSYYFVIPQFEILKIKEKIYFAFNIAKSDITPEKINKCIKELKCLSFSCDELRFFTPEIGFIKNIPEKAQWANIFKKIIKPADGMILEKIVLAKKTVVEFTNKLNYLGLFYLLKKHTKNCFHYYFQLSKDTVFLGASPEQLLRVNGSKVESEAIAGTKPRGLTRKEDKFLLQKLINSNKEMIEHQFVVNMIYNTLNKFCLSLHYDNEFSILKVSTCQHLITHFRGILKNDIKSYDALLALHPTPAVAGCPTDKALDIISEVEPFERGWYAGPIGFVGHNCFEFAVALRCAMIKGLKANLYAGAGIVEGSIAEEEWYEIENKSSIFMSIFKNILDYDKSFKN